MIGFPSSLFFLFIIIIPLIFGYLGGSMAKNDGHSFWLGFAIGLFGNIAGLLILAYVGDTFKKRTFDPAFKKRPKKKASAINTLAKLNEQDKLSDQEFERLKQEIIRERPRETL